MARPGSVKTPKSELPVEVVVRSRGLQITVKGTISDLSKELSSISKFVDLANSKLSDLSSPSTTRDDEAVAGVDIDADEQAPVIKVSKSLADNVLSLFNTSWGKTPRTLQEVSKALEVNAVPAQLASINLALTRSIRRGTLRRIKRSGRWAYYRLPVG